MLPNYKLYHHINHRHILPTTQLKTESVYTIHCNIHNHYILINWLTTSHVFPFAPVPQTKFILVSRIYILTISNGIVDPLTYLLHRYKCRWVHLNTMDIVQTPITDSTHSLRNYFRLYTNTLRRMSYNI